MFTVLISSLAFLLGLIIAISLASSDSETDWGCLLAIMFVTVVFIVALFFMLVGKAVL